MPRTLAAGLRATPRESLAEVRGVPLKASLREPQAQLAAPLLREVAADALWKTTSQTAAAIDIEISDGRLSHKLKDGSLTLKQLEKLGPQFGAEFGAGCRRVFGEPDLKERLRREIRETRARLDGLAELAEDL